VGDLLRKLEQAIHEQFQRFSTVRNFGLLLHGHLAEGLRLGQICARRLIKNARETAATALSG
jgi:hypothetical protein